MRLQVTKNANLVCLQDPLEFRSDQSLAVLGAAYGVNKDLAQQLSMGLLPSIAAPFQGAVAYH